MSEPTSPAQAAGRKQRVPDELTEYRLDQLEQALKPLRSSLDEIQRQLTRIATMQAHQGDLRTEIAACRADHYAADTKLWERFDDHKEKLGRMRLELAVERGRIDALHRPLWLLFAAFIGHAALTYFLK